MEAVHRSNNRSWIDGTIINVKHFRDWSDAPPSESAFGNRNETLKNLISEEEFLEIENLCGLETMRCAHQEKVEPADSINLPDEVTLEVLKFQEEDLQKRKELTKHAANFYNSQKYSNYPPHKILASITCLDNIPFEPVDTPEVVINVQIYVPERKLQMKTNSLYTKIPTFKVDQEFLVLGSQYLTELRDKIDCISDQVISGDYSELPTDEPSVTCKDLYKSGYFYINGVFYNDMRDKDCRDYSEVIIKWAVNEKRKIGPFKKAVMENTRFVDLNIQLGYPYLYTHQGECEHLIVFSDLRMFTKHEVANRNAYPLYVSLKPKKRVFCMVCHAFTSSWVVYDNCRLPENPFFFCKTCFISFNYDVNNQKIGNFKAYRFPDRSKLT